MIIAARAGFMAFFLGVCCAPAQSQTADVLGPFPEPPAANVALPIRLNGDALHLIGGFGSVPGSYVGLTWSTDAFASHEIVSLTAIVGDRLRRGQIGILKPAAFGTRTRVGATLYGQRFHYDQARESSLTAFDRAIPVFDSYSPDDLVDYISDSYGGTVFAQYPAAKGLAHFDLTYGFDLSRYSPESVVTQEYFDQFDFEARAGENSLTWVRTSKIVPSYTYDSLNNTANPTRGAFLSVAATLAGPGGNVNLIEPAVEARYFQRGVWRRHVVAMRLRGRMLSGYGGKRAPPFDRYYMGGEDDIRGFSSWEVSPISVMPGAVRLPVLNVDGNPVVLSMPVNGVATPVPFTFSIPIYRIFNPGGDTNVTANFEYRIPIRGRLTAVLFVDAGVNRITFESQLKLNSEYVNGLNQMFPDAGYGQRLPPYPATQPIRMSTGAELQFLVPKVNVPIRFYWANNLRALGGYVQPPVVFDRSSFANNESFLQAIAAYGTAVPYFEHRNTFRIAVGRTF